MNGTEPGLAFVDSSVFVYALAMADDPRSQTAARLITHLLATGRARLSLQVIAEVANVLTRRLAPPIPTGDAIEIAADLGRLMPHRPETEDVLAALRLSAERQLSFWDAMIVRSAGVLGCEVLYSEDLQDGATIGGVRIENPFRI